MHTQALMVCQPRYINGAINTYYLVMVKLFVACLIFFGGGESHSWKNCPRKSLLELGYHESTAEVGFPPLM